MTTELVQLSHARLLTQDGRGRRLRLDARIGLRELADQIGVDPATLSRWERGASFPRSEAALKWLGALQSLEQPSDGMIP